MVDTTMAERSQLEDNEPETTSYDRVPYKSFPFRQSHPERLATIAHLHGVQSRPIGRCRVLEIGCASGGNILPLADRMPDSEFVGIDLSRHQIEEGRRLAEAASLTNLQLINADIRSFDQTQEPFDYIIAHGVYSWIPDDAQQALLDVCGRMLSEGGIAYVSYNTFPGWRMRGIVRDMMSYHTRGEGKPEDQVRKARALLNFLAESVPTEENPYGLLLNQELRQLQDKEDYYLLHEHLEDVNEPVYFADFAQRVCSRGLQYLGEADFSVMAIENFPPTVASMLQNLANDILETEQYMDFVRNRMFRQTLLCRQEIDIDRGLSPSRVRELHVASKTKPKEPIRSLADNSPVVFEAGNSVTKTTDPLMKAALAHLGQCWPRYIPFSELVAIARSLITGKAALVDKAGSSPDAERLGRSLLRCYATGHVELSVSPPVFRYEPTDRPLASRLTRVLAAKQPLVTNAKHETVPLSDIEQRLLVKLDGQADIGSLVDLVYGLIEQGQLIAHTEGKPVSDGDERLQIAKDAVESALQGFAAKALLLQGES